MTWPVYIVPRRCRSCLIGCVYYICCVVVIENLLVFLYWQAAQPSLPLVFVQMDGEGGAPQDLEGGIRNGTLLINDSLSSSTASRGTNFLLDKFSKSTINISTSTPRSILNSKPSSKIILPTRTEDLEKAFYRKRPEKVNPYFYNFVITPKAKCAADTFMIILVHSFHPHTDRRSAIRDTWGSIVRTMGQWPRYKLIESGLIPERILLAFILGHHPDPGLNDLIREEAERYDDIVVGDFHDSYRNMTLKSLLGLKLVMEHCPGVKYILKSDDDMFINMPYLVDILKAQAFKRTIMGPYNVGSKAYRSGKWRLTMEEFPFIHLPPYESGSAYIITGDLSRELFETAEYVPSIFIDDVYITGILGRILNVTHAKQGGFAFWTNHAPGVCDVAARKIVTGTKMTPRLLRSVWKELNRSDELCFGTKSSKLAQPPPQHTKEELSSLARFGFKNYPPQPPGSSMNNVQIIRKGV